MPIPLTISGEQRMRQVRTKFLGTARRPSPPRGPRVRCAFLSPESEVGGVSTAEGMTP